MSNAKIVVAEGYRIPNIDEFVDLFAYEALINISNNTWEERSYGDYNTLEYEMWYSKEEHRKFLENEIKLNRIRVKL